MKTKRQNRKVHFFFSLGLVIVLVIGLAPKMASGEHFFQALWGGFKDVRPVEWIMFFGLWFTVIKNNFRAGWFKPPQTLGLADRQ